MAIRELVQKPIFKLGALLLPLLLGLAFLARDYCEYREGQASVNWTAAKGKILHNSVKAERPFRGRMIFTPIVSYSYHIGDDAYRGCRMTFPDQLPSPEKDLKKLLADIEIGREITAYYDPKNVSHVTLIRGVRQAKYCRLFLQDAAIAATTPLLYGYFLLRRRKKIS